MPIKFEHWVYRFIVYLYGKSPKSIFAVFRYLKLVKQFGPDAIQGWMYHANVLAMLGRFVCRSAKVLFNIRHSLQDWQGEKRLTPVGYPY